MIPVNQTIFTAPGGNCFQACVASVLELPLDAVPHFLADVKEVNQKWTQERWDAVCAFGKKHKHKVCWLDPDIPGDQEFIPKLHGSEMHYIACGTSFGGPWGHCVVWHKGHAVHDPTPHSLGLDGDPWLYIFFERFYH